MNSNNRIAATLYSLGNIVCLRNISINTLHKGDDDDDDDDNKNNNNSRDRNVIKKEAEKILKYIKYMKTLQRMWNVNTNVIPVAPTGTISKSFRKYVSNIPGKHEVKELQKTAILGTAHILRKVLM